MACRRWTASAPGWRGERWGPPLPSGRGWRGRSPSRVRGRIFEVKGSGGPNSAPRGSPSRMRIEQDPPLRRVRGSSIPPSPARAEKALATSPPLRGGADGSQAGRPSAPPERGVSGRFAGGEFVVPVARQKAGERRDAAKQRGPDRWRCEAATERGKRQRADETGYGTVASSTAPSRAASAGLRRSGAGPGGPRRAGGVATEPFPGSSAWQVATPSLPFSPPSSPPQTRRSFSV